MNARREHWGSRIGFVLAAAGSAVGLGNIWKYPHMAGENGGAAFTLVYLLCILVVGLPILLAELAIGRLPVDQTSDLQQLVDKIVTYEAMRNPGLWQARTVLMDDDPAFGETINKMTDWMTRMELGVIPPVFESYRFSANPESDIGALDDTEIRESFNQGALLISYFAHGWIDSCGDLSVMDIAHLNPECDVTTGLRRPIEGLTYGVMEIDQGRGLVCTLDFKTGSMGLQLGTRIDICGKPADRDSVIGF